MSFQNFIASSIFCNFLSATEKKTHTMPRHQVHIPLFLPYKIGLTRWLLKGYEIKTTSENKKWILHLLGRGRKRWRGKDTTFFIYSHQSAWKFGCHNAVNRRRGKYFTYQRRGNVANEITIFTLRMKAYITAEEWRRVYFEPGHGSINNLPDKILVEVEPLPPESEYLLKNKDKCFCGSAECPAWKSANKKNEKSL